MYAKVYGSILKSSIWDESLPTRILWITMLVLADEHGYVKAVERGLARAANLSQEDVRAGLETLLAPDLESQSQEWGGRRIEKVEGGWLVLNYAKYREYRTRAQVRAAERAQRHRDKLGGANSASDNADCDSSRASRPVTTIATASAIAVGAVPRAREDVDNSTSPDVSRAPDIGVAMLEPEADPIRALLAAHRDKGEDTRWCIECGGQKVTIGGSPHLRHRSWCPRRT